MRTYEAMDRHGSPVYGSNRVVYNGGQKSWDVLHFLYSAMNFHPPPSSNIGF